MPPRAGTKKSQQKLSDVVSRPIGDAEIAQVVNDAKAMSLPPMPKLGGLPPIGLPVLPPIGQPMASAPTAQFNSAVLENKIADLLTKQALDAKKDAQDSHKIMASFFEAIMKDVRELKGEIADLIGSFSADKLLDVEKPKDVSPLVAAVVKRSHEVAELYAKSGQPLTEAQYGDLIYSVINDPKADPSFKTVNHEECYDAFIASLT